MNPSNTSILIVTPDKNLRHKLETLLQDEHHIHSASSTEDGLEALYETPFQLVLLSLTSPDDKGLEVLQRIRTRYPETDVIAIAAHKEAARKALDLGAFYCLPKDFHDEQARVLIQRVRETQVAERKMLHLSDEMDSYLKEDVAILLAPKSREALSITQRLTKLPPSHADHRRPWNAKGTGCPFRSQGSDKWRSPFPHTGNWQA